MFWKKIISRDFMPNTINTMKEEHWRKFSNSLFWNGLDYKNKKDRFLLCIMLIEVDIIVSQRFFLSCWRRGEGWVGISWDFPGFQSPHGSKFAKKSELKNNSRSSLKKRLFSGAFEVPKNFLNNLRNSKTSGTRYFNHQNIIKIRKNKNWGG